MKKLSIEQQELLQQMMQGNDLRPITPFKALEIIKKQVGNIHVFTDEMPPQQTTIELRNSGLFEIVYQALDKAEKNEYMRENIKISVIATPRIETIETPAGTFYKVELAFNEEKLKKFKEWLEK